LHVLFLCSYIGLLCNYIPFNNDIIVYLDLNFTNTYNTETVDILKQ